jgi:hypothetical protein
MSVKSEIVTASVVGVLWKFAAREKVGVTGCCNKISYAKTLKEPKFFFQKFLEVERKCRAMAEKFK